MADIDPAEKRSDEFTKRVYHSVDPEREDEALAKVLPKLMSHLVNCVETNHSAVGAAI
jgi:hypothetical protein